MKILYLSNGVGLALAVRLAQEGHETKVFIHNDYSDTGQNVFERISAWKPYVNRSDLVIADDPLFGYKELRFENAPTRTLGISRFLSIANRSASSRRKLLDLTGFDVVDTGPSTYSVEAWWNGRKWCTPFILVKYYKNLISDAVGPSLGAMVTICQTLEDIPTALFEGFKNLKPLFEKGYYRGPIRLDFVDTSVYDFYAGFTYDNTEAILEGVQESPLDILLEVAGGVRSDLNLIPGNYCAIRLQHIGWPTTRDYRIYGLVDANIKHCGLSNVLLKHGHYYCSQTFGPILKVTARGDQVKDSFNRASRTLANIEVEDICYRADLVQQFSKTKYNDFDNILNKWKATKATNQKSAGGKTKSTQE